MCVSVRVLVWCVSVGVLVGVCASEGASVVCVPVRVLVWCVCQWGC